MAGEAPKNNPAGPDHYRQKLSGAAVTPPLAREERRKEGTYLVKPQSAGDQKAPCLLPRGLSPGGSDHLTLKNACQYSAITRWLP